MSIKEKDQEVFYCKEKDQEVFYFKENI